MSTRSTIVLKIKDEDVGKNFYRNNVMLTFGKYMSIYCHHDGNVDGVGKELSKYYNDYDSILDLILSGDCSSIGCAYSKYEDYNSNKPKCFNTIPPIEEEYQYVFYNNIWHVTDKKGFYNDTIFSNNIDIHDEKEDVDDSVLVKKDFLSNLHGFLNGLYTISNNNIYNNYIDKIEELLNDKN